MNRSRILIVEDQLIVAEDLARLLEESGHEVIGIAETGEEAVKTALETSPDLVLLDIRLRGAIDGIEAAQAIRTHVDPAIVYVTAHSATSLFERARQTEPDGYLFKPISPVELTRTVEIVLFKHAMEKRLRESEGKYRELVETISDGIVKTDTIGTVNFANPAYCRMLGFTMEEIIGTSILAFQVSESQREEMRAYLEYIASQQPPPVTWSGTHRTKDGGLIAVESDWNYRRDEQGHVTGFIAVVKDVTERKKAEDALRRSEEEFRRIIENLQDPFYRADMDGVLTFLSPASERVAGYKPEEGVGRSITMFYANPAERQEFMKLMLENGFVNDFEARLVHKDGHTVWVSTSARLYKDKDGKIAGVEGIARDISGRKKVELALRNSERRFRDLVELLPHYVFELDLTGRLIFLNPSGLAATGYTHDDIERGLSVVEVVSPADKDRLLANFSKIASSEKTCGNEYTLVSKEGKELSIISYSVPIVVQGDPVGLRGVAVDISEIRLAQKALRESEEKYRTLFERAGDAIFLVETNGDEAGKIVSANPAGARMHGYSTEELLGVQISALDAPEQIPKFSERILSIKSEDWIKEEILHRKKDGTIFPVEVTAGLLPSQNHKYIFSVARDISVRKEAELEIKASELKFRNILETIADGYHEVDLKGNLTLVNDSLCEILGYPREELLGTNYRKLMDEPKAKGIFQAYNGVYGTGKSHPGFNCQIIRKDGSIRDISVSISLIRDEDGLPKGFRGIMRDVTERKRLEEQLYQATKMPTFGTETLLVVDDEESIRELAKELLNSVGYKVLTASTGQEAIEIYAEGQEVISLVLLDLIMPEMDGRKCLQELLKISPSVRVLVASGYSANGPAGEVATMGAKGHVGKPYNVRELLRMVRTVLDAE